MADIALRCSGCARSFSPDEPIWFCASCGAVLEIPLGPSIVGISARAETLSVADDAEARGVWRYRRFIPVDADRAVSLGEGDTPVVPLVALGRELGLPRLYAKLEYFSPTGSFKDRGTTVLISRAREMGATHVVEDSSGNAGASVAAYAAAAGIRASIYVPASAPAAKKAQIAFYGAEVVAIGGTRDDVTEAALERCAREGAFLASHNANPYFLEGTKTFAYEVAARFRGDPPEQVVMPVGNGSLLLGAWKGFQELRAMGAVDRVPKLHMVQATGCMPIVDAFQRGLDRTESIPTSPTVAGGISIGRPSRGHLVLRALRESGGGGVAVTDQEILASQRLLAAREGIFCEPTSAAAFAALPHLVRLGAIDPGERVLVAVTGSGLKDVAVLPPSPPL